MANKRVPEFPVLTNPAPDDKLYIVDTSDTSEAPSGSSRHIDFSALSAAIGGGRAAAWAAFDGTVPELLGSFNVSSLEELGTGYYKLNFATSFAATTYAALFGTQRESSKLNAVNAYIGQGDETIRLFIQGETDIVDGSVYQHLIGVEGDAEIDSDTILLGGTGYLSIADDESLHLDGNFTVEFEMSTTSTGFAWLIDKYLASDPNYLQVYVNDGTGRVVVELALGAVINGTAIVNDGDTHHVAVVRNGSTVTLYIDGVADGTDSYSGVIAPACDLNIGRYREGGSRRLVGRLSNIRITAAAVYTSNFTPPTSFPYPDQGVGLDYIYIETLDASGIRTATKRVCVAIES